ncbi:MAG: hypothetical protein HZB51_16755 [Chloroflexi bacterium]|nr:hypothetical protein [Chloroflexota bacterium]
MIDLAESKLFTPIKNADNGVPIYLLTHKVAPLQQNFYFVNNGMTDDGRFLWFYCAFPPSPIKTLGLLDLEAQTVRHFPETQFSGSSPWVDPVSGFVYWAAHESIWCRGPHESETVQCVNSLPEDVVRERTVYRMATHLTRSADGKEFFIDAALGLQWVFGTLPINGGDFQPWQRFDRNYNHAQFSPTDPNLVLFAEENHPDPITGLKFPIIDRMWLIERGKRARPVFSTPTRVTHEWWDEDGQHVWCVWGNQAWRTNIVTQEIEKIDWQQHCWHAHHSRSAHTQCLVSDSNERFYRGCPSGVHFLNRVTGKEIQIIRHPEMSNFTGARYHIDPHPRFCGQDRFVVFTTVIRGQVDLAIVKTSDLIERT